MQRLLLFLATNLAVVMVLSVTMRLLGVESYLNANGLQLTSLLAFSAILGFSGALISLALSKWSAKMSMGVDIIKTPSNPTEAWLLETVRQYASQAGISMPEVGVYNAPDVNAFATGMRKNSALIAVSTGLLQQMTRPQAQAVLAHEVTHAANGDMVTMALIQGVINTFVIFLSRVIGAMVDKLIFKTERGQGPAFFITMIIAELVLGVLASIIVMGFSRQREFRADRGGADLAGRANMIAALQQLAASQPQALPAKLAAFGILGGRGSGIKRLFMTHPPLAERIAALQAMP